MFSRSTANLPIILSARRWVSGFIGNKGSAFFHALQDDDDTFVAAEAAIIWRDELVLASAFWGREDGDAAMRGIAIHPRAIVLGAACKNLGSDGINPADVPEKVDDVCRTLEPFIVSTEHDAVPDAIGKIDKSAEKL